MSDAVAPDAGRPDAPQPDTPAPTRPLGFARDLWRRSGHRAPVAVLLQVLSTLSESASILLLVPILGMIDRGGGAPVVQLPDTGPIGALTRGASVGLPVVLAALVALVGIAALLNRWRTIYTTDLIYALVNAIRIDLVTAMARSGWSAFSHIRDADLTHVLTGDVERLESAASGVLSVVQTAALIAVYLAVSVAISPVMSLVAAVAGCLFALVLTPIRRRAHALGQAITKDRREQYRIAADAVQGMKIAKLYGAEDRMTDRFGGNLQTMRDDALRFRRFAASGHVLVQVANALGLAIFVYGALLWADLALPEIVVMLFIFMRVAPRFLVLQSLTQQVLQNLPVVDAVERTRRMFEREREVPGPEAGVSAPDLTRTLDARGLGFRYAGPSGTEALRNVSFSLPAGQALAVVGASGAGKSTLADILLGLVAPTAGELRVDGQSVAGETRRAWRTRVAFVPQEIVLLHDTILANLRLAAPDADEADARRALEQAQAWGFVSALPEGMHTVVGDGGGRLSGGERQRIAIAQALMRKPRLLVLDEATSALDWENQAATARALSDLRGQTTLVTIAHRPSMIALADHVIVLDRGTLVESGPYDQLAARPDSRLARIMAAENA